MADEVINIIQRLSYEVVGADTIKNTTDALNKQADNIERLKTQLNTLNAAYKTETNVKAQQNLSGAILKTTESIEKQTKAMSNQFANSKPLQQAITLELGLIQKLTDKIKDLTHARERQTSTGGIQEINRQLAVTKQELQELTTIGAASGGNNILASLFGFGGNGSSFGRQLLTGGLIGLGIGSGMGLITRAVSALVEYGEAQLDVIKQQEDLKKSNEELIKSFTSLTDQIQKEILAQKALDETFEHDVALREAVANNTVAGQKRIVDAVKATGVVNGKEYEAKLAQFNEEQKLRDKELEDIQKKKEAIGSVQMAIAKANGLNNQGVIGAFASSDIPKAQKDEIILALRKRIQEGQSATSTPGNRDEVDLKKFFADLNKQYVSERDKADEEERQNRSDKANQEKAFISAHNTSLFELRKKLDRQNQDERTKSLEEQYAKEMAIVNNEDKILLDLKVKMDAELLKVDRERQDEADKLAVTGGKISTATEQDFVDQKIIIQKRYYEQSNAALTEFHKQQKEAQEKVNENMLKSDIKTGLENIVTGVRNENPQVGDYLQVARDRMVQANMLLTEQRKQELVIADKYNLDKKRINEIYDRAEIAQNKLNNQAELDALITFYNAAQAIIKQKSDALILEAQTKGEVLQATNAAVFLGDPNIISSGTFKRRQKQQGYRNTLNELDAASKGKATELNSAQDELTRRDNSVSSPEYIDEQKTAVNQLTKSYEALAVAKANTVSDHIIEQTMKEIQAYQSIADTVVKSYNIINEARQKDLDREISVRTQRVDLALKIAERGNTEVLAIEQKGLEKAEQQKRKAALQQQEINAALVISNSLVAVAQAFATGAGAIVLVPLILAGLAAGFAEVTALGEAQKQSFAKGVVGFRGKGTATSDSNPVNISDGESVITAAATRKYSPMLKMMNEGINPFSIFQPQYINNSEFASKQELREIKKGLGEIVDAVNGKSVNISQRIDKGGVRQMVVEENRRENLRWTS